MRMLWSSLAVRRALVAVLFAVPISACWSHEFMCSLLGLKPAKNDGDPAQTSTFIVW